VRGLEVFAFDVTDDLVAEAVARCSREDFGRWEQLVAQAGHCVRPIRMVGSVDQVDKASGEVRRVYSTEGEPDNCLFLPCKTRRESVCPLCADVHRGHNYHLILAGLVGGKGVPLSVVSHPAVFATFTAPGFGAVHAHRTKGHQLQACRPRRGGERCPHGVRVSCSVVHPKGGPRLGTPICPECFDYEGMVLWNRMAPKLWKRSTTFIRRRLAAAAGLKVRELKGVCKVRFAKVAEYQQRGALHFHAVIRLDGVSEDDSLVPPPTEFTTELLQQAIEETVRDIRVVGVDGLPELAWGEEVHVRQLRRGAPEDLKGEAVAAYVAKYSTKSAESLACGESGLSPHIRRVIETAWELSSRPAHKELRLGEAARDLGFRGHFSTRSPRYSTTMTAIRRGQREFARRKRLPEGGRLLDGWDRPEEEDQVVVEARWRFAGTGYRTNGEAWLALSAAARAREHRRIVWELRTSAGSELAV
jgi:replication initiator protein RepSA